MMDALTPAIVMNEPFKFVHEDGTVTEHPLGMVDRGGGDDPDAPVVQIDGQWVTSRGLWGPLVTVETRAWFHRDTNDWKGIDELRPAGTAVIKFDGQPVYNVGYNAFNTGDSLISIANTIQKLLGGWEIPWDGPGNYESLIGRDVWYRHYERIEIERGVVGRVLPDMGEIVIDGIYDSYNDHMGIVVDVLDPMIIWYDPAPTIIDGGLVSAFVAKAWTATEYPTTEWPDSSFTGWTDKTGPFELWQEPNGHIFAKAGDGTECPEMFPVTISADGSIRGFYAIEGQCHIGYLGQGVCVPATLDTEFTEFHEKPIRLASGANLNIGFGTALDDHVSGELPGDKVVQVQVDLSTLVCALRAVYYPGAGIWLSGHMLPGVDKGLVAAMRLGYPSGHWAADTGEHSLRIFHWVTKPGYAPKWYVPRAGDAGVVTASVMLPVGAARQGVNMSDVESVQAGSVYVIKPIVGPRESERVRWPDGVGRFASLEDATDGASFYRVQPEIDGLLSDEYALVPVADAELTGEVYEWGYQDEDSPDGSPFGTKIVDEAPSTHETVAAACCSTCAESGGTCAGRKKKKMVAAETDMGDETDSPDLASAVAELSARLDAKYDELDARLAALETEETIKEPDETVDEEPMTASAAAFPANVLAAITANV